MRPEKWDKHGTCKIVPFHEKYDFSLVKIENFGNLPIFSPSPPSTPFHCVKLTYSKYTVHTSTINASMRCFHEKYHQNGIWISKSSSLTNFLSWKRIESLLYYLDHFDEFLIITKVSRKIMSFGIKKYHSFDYQRKLLGFPHWNNQFNEKLSIAILHVRKWKVPTTVYLLVLTSGPLFVCDTKELISRRTIVTPSVLKGVDDVETSFKTENISNFQKLPRGGATITVLFCSCLNGCAYAWCDVEEEEPKFPFD